MARDRGAAQAARLGRLLAAASDRGGAAAGSEGSLDDVADGPRHAEGRVREQARDHAPPTTGWRAGGVPAAAAVLALVVALVVAWLLLGLPGVPGALGGGEVVVGPAPPSASADPGAPADLVAAPGAVPGTAAGAAPGRADADGSASVLPSAPGSGGAAGGAVRGGGPSPSVAGGRVGPLVVHVDGAVARPGVVTVPAGSRVSDAVAAAGGVTPAADTRLVNLARVLTDGELVVVPVPGDPPSALDPGTGAGGEGPDGGSGTAGAGGQGAAGSAGGAAPGAPVDLNTADAAALDALPGIGPVLAQRIVAHRDEVGPFASVEDLETVSGIGPAVLANVRDLVTV